MMFSIRLFIDSDPDNDPDHSLKLLRVISEQKTDINSFLPEH